MFELEIHHNNSEAFGFTYSASINGKMIPGKYITKELAIANALCWIEFHPVPQKIDPKKPLPVGTEVKCDWVDEIGKVVGVKPGMVYSDKTPGVKVWKNVYTIEFKDGTRTTAVRKSLTLV